MLSQLPQTKHGDPTVPRPLTANLEVLHDNPYLMEDVWVSATIQTTPPWLTDSKVHKGIHAMLKKDWCVEERQHLGRDVNGMCWWFGKQLTAIELAIQTNIGNVFPYYYSLTTYHLHSTTT